MSSTLAGTSADDSSTSITTPFPDLNFETDSIIQSYENGNCIGEEYDKQFKEDVHKKLQDFSSWFSSVARLYLLKCGKDEKESLLYQLITLRKQVKHAITELNSSIARKQKVISCKFCNDKIIVKPNENIWSVLQQHEHFEENYAKSLVSPKHNNEDKTVTDHVIQSLNAIKLESKRPPPPSHLNDFRFNFKITYDRNIEISYYPALVMEIVAKIDNVSDYTLQRISPERGICLLCKTNLLCEFNISSPKINSHLIHSKHREYAKDNVLLAFLSKFHEFWKSQETDYQSHQIYFFPESSHFPGLNCHLCFENVEYNAVINHILGDKHKDKFIKILKSPGNTGLLLLDLQAKVYDNKQIPVPQGISNKSKFKPRLYRNRNNVSEKQTCVVTPVELTASNFYLSERFKEHRKFFVLKPNGFLSCKVCQTTCQFDAKSVYDHVINKVHQKKSAIPLVNYDFFCEICGLILPEKRLWDEHFVQNAAKHDSVIEVRKRQLCEYECSTCHIVIFGDELSVHQHMHPRRPKKKLELPMSVKKFFNSKQFIFEQSQLLLMEASKVSQNHHKMKDCCEDLCKAVAEKFPNCRAHPFGSRRSGLGSERSDLDIFLDVGDMYLGDRNQDALIQKQFVNKVTKILRSTKYDFKVLACIASARTPIVRIKHTYTGLECDVSFKHGLGVENTLFLRYCMELQPITQSLILMLKKWSEYCKLNEEINNYGLALMAIFYLQVEEFLLPVSKIRKLNNQPSLIIDGWETIKYTVPIEQMRKFIKPYPATIIQLLRNFFYFYSKFDYANDIVCPLLGHTIKKFTINETPEKLPPELQTYVAKVKNGNGEVFRGLSPMCIQDPFDLSHNLTKACPHDVLNKFKTFCTLTCEFLDTL